MKTEIMTQDTCGIAADYDSPSTCAPLVPVGAIALPTARQAAANTALSSKWQAAVTTCNDLHSFLDMQARAATDAAKRHLFASLSLGCLINNMAAQAAGDGISIKALFADYKGPEQVRERALAISGGGIGFTYATGNKYVKLYREHYRRLQEATSPKDAARIVAEHAQMLVAGAYGDTTAAVSELWGPYVSAENMRQAWLELTPEKPAANLATVLQQAEGAAECSTWAAQREKLCATFGGLFDNLETYILKSSMYVTPTDREQMACKLEEAAAKLREQPTQKDITGLIPAND